jgi:FKBP12-rapamycin complex-associated protein
MARIDIQVPEIRNLLNELLIKISREHPQALIYQVTVSSKSKSKLRKEAAFKVLYDMKSANA